MLSPGLHKEFCPTYVPLHCVTTTRSLPLGEQGCEHERLVALPSSHAPRMSLESLDQQSGRNPAFPPVHAARRLLGTDKLGRRIPRAAALVARTIDRRMILGTEPCSCDAVVKLVKCCRKKICGTHLKWKPTIRSKRTVGVCASCPAWQVSEWQCESKHERQCAPGVPCIPHKLWQSHLARESSDS